jgi:HlyD family secretion protein
LVLPLQALVSRDPEAESVLAKNHGKKVETSGPPDAVSASATVTKQQGVYVLKNENGKLRVYFRTVQTGITGATEIQVLNGLQPGDEVVTGRYKTLRTLTSGTTVKRDTKADASSTENA